MVQRPNIMKAHVAEIETTSKLHSEIQNALLHVCESKLQFSSNLRIFGLVTISVDDKNNDIVVKLSKEWIKDTTTSITPTITDTTFTPIAPAPRSQTKSLRTEIVRRTLDERSNPYTRQDHRCKKTRYRTRTAPDHCCRTNESTSIPNDILQPSAFSTPQDKIQNRHRGTLSAPCYLPDQTCQPSARKRIIQSMGKKFQAIRQASRHSEASCTPGKFIINFHCYQNTFVKYYFYITPLLKNNNSDV